MGRHRLLLAFVALSLVLPGPAGALTDTTTDTTLDDGNTTDETTLDGNSTTNATSLDGNETDTSLDDGNATGDETAGNTSLEADAGCTDDGCEADLLVGETSENASDDGAAADATGGHAPASGEVGLDCLVRPGDADCQTDASGEAGDGIVEQAWAMAAELRCRTGGSGLPCQGNATAEPGSTPNLVDELKDVCILGTCLF